MFSQCVQLFHDFGNCILSFSTNVLCGVPQGSVLGPTLFNVFTNHALSIVSIKSTLYADDLKLLGPALSCGDHILLQNSLQLLGQWAGAWLLEFNVVKYNIIHIDKLNPCHSYFFLGHPFSFVNNEQDLGVTNDN